MFNKEPVQATPSTTPFKRKPVSAQVYAASFCTTYSFKHSTWVSCSNEVNASASSVASHSGQSSTSSFLVAPSMSLPTPRPANNNNNDNGSADKRSRKAPIAFVCRSFTLEASVCAEIGAACTRYGGREEHCGASRHKGVSARAP
eukprot:CAMPEP_0176161540 /NCGR_PEP_ID=MMETSP0120_2-20121206/82647_1 /TAXON_ID=160619 /ORGANISM="Kryptoperidinium foliaceum, Strain CCMP 1326" /LENGTH=144 /DNA_ID=CAMNT_0017499027 /DNA_START=73 /DNA_END=504 /DNA_ORIENTATION=-